MAEADPEKERQRLIRLRLEETEWTSGSSESEGEEEIVVTREYEVSAEGDVVLKKEETQKRELSRPMKKSGTLTGSGEKSPRPTESKPEEGEVRRQEKKANEDDAAIEPEEKATEKEEKAAAAAAEKEEEEKGAIKESKKEKRRSLKKENKEATERQPSIIPSKVPTSSSGFKSPKRKSAGGGRGEEQWGNGVHSRESQANKNNSWRRSQDLVSLSKKGSGSKISQDSNKTGSRKRVLSESFSCDNFGSSTSNSNNNNKNNSSSVLPFSSSAPVSSDVISLRPASSSSSSSSSSASTVAPSSSPSSAAASPPSSPPPKIEEPVTDTPAAKHSNATSEKEKNLMPLSPRTAMKPTLLAISGGKFGKKKGQEEKGGSGEFFGKDLTKTVSALYSYSDRLAIVEAANADAVLPFQTRADLAEYERRERQRKARLEREKEWEREKERERAEREREREEAERERLEREREREREREAQLQAVVHNGVTSPEAERKLQKWSLLLKLPQNVSDLRNQLKAEDEMKDWSPRLLERTISELLLVNPEEGERLLEEKIEMEKKRRKELKRKSKLERATLASPVSSKKGWKRLSPEETRRT
ncbi:Leucine zipper, putative tumor suppressor family member 3b [Balamuthia mandrillaris]